MPVTIFKCVVGLVAAACLLLTLQLSPQGLRLTSDEPGARAASHASWILQRDLSRFGPGSGARQLVEADKPSDTPRMIVAATQDPAEAAWLQDVLGNFTEVRLYQVVTDSERRAACQNATAANDADAIKELSCWPHLASGSGREASVYLRYIVDEYDHGLADTTVFIHGHAEAWHRPSVGGFVETMRRLRWGEVGFASLRTWGTLGNNYWDTAVMIDPVEPPRCSNILRNTKRWHGFCEYQGNCLQTTWQQLGLNDTFGRMPHEVHAPGCCAEFVVSRERIRARPKQFYVNLLARLDALGDHPDTPYALEHCWHAFFGEPWVSYGIGKCQMVACSEEEENDPDLQPPTTINDPYSFHQPPKPTEECHWDGKTWHCKDIPAEVEVA